MPDFTLIDDGTLDTVVACDDCGKEIRFEGEMLLEGIQSENPWYRSKVRITNALALAEEEHECEGET